MFGIYQVSSFLRLFPMGLTTGVIGKQVLPFVREEGSSTKMSKVEVPRFYPTLLPFLVREWGQRELPLRVVPLSSLLL